MAIHQLPVVHENMYVYETDSDGNVVTVINMLASGRTLITSGDTDLNYISDTQTN